jgi:nitroreductase
MPISIQSIIESRVSTTRFDSQRSLSKDHIQKLLKLTTCAPTAYNLQNWRFLALMSDEAKQRLHPIAYNQSQILEAAATIVICGRLHGFTQLAENLKPAVDQGMLPEQVASAWVSAATQSHQDNAVLQRDEAFRSASLAAMTLMLAAQGMGLASGPMSGFDAAALHREFALDEEDVPVVLVTLGYPAHLDREQQKPRRALESVASFL